MDFVEKWKTCPRCGDGDVFVTYPDGFLYAKRCLTCNFHYTIGLPGPTVVYPGQLTLI